MRAANCMRDYGTTNNTPAHQALPVWRAPEGLEDLTAAQVGDGGACQHTNDKPDRSGAPRGLRGLAGHHTDTPTDWRPPRGLRGLAAVPVGDGGAAPVTWRCTRYVAVHPNRRDVMPTDRVHCPHQQAQPRIRTPPHGQALHHWACAHVVEGLFMRLWSRPLIVAGIGVVPQEPEEGPAAVPVGGGRAWPGFEIDHSERSSRVAISRAGRRPPAPTRRHKHSATNA